MEVFKFGGASVKDAESVKNVAKIIQQFSAEKLLVVVSAMGKTTNKMEELVNTYFQKNDCANCLKELRTFHFEIVSELFPDKNNKAYEAVTQLFKKLESKLAQKPSDSFEFEYDQIVSYGELLSSTIIARYVNEQITCEWVDAREVIRTNHCFKESEVIWEKTQELLTEKLTFNKGVKVYVTQGFIGGTEEKQTTTLGREGSDFSAAVLAYCMNASKMIIWKDVQGMLNADPKWFDDTTRIPKLSFKEAIELSYYGATIIHPKTLKPLQNKGIPLYVKSFLNPENEGTVIQENTEDDHLIPSFIFKIEQVLVSIMPKDFSFIVEENLGGIFQAFAKARVKINLMQISALSFSVCVGESEKLYSLLDELRSEYKILYNRGQELVTIRHYDQVTINRVCVDKKVMLEQRTRQTIRMVLHSV